MKMKKIVIGIIMVMAISISTTAAIGESADDSGMSFETDTSYNTAKETTTTDFGIAANLGALGMSVMPSYSWDDNEIADIEYGIELTIKLNDSLSITPYTELHTDKSFNYGDKFIGIKTSMKF